MVHILWSEMIRDSKHDNMLGPCCGPLLLETPDRLISTVDTKRLP